MLRQFSRDAIVKIFDKIWCFVEFNNEMEAEEKELRKSWFLEVVWTKKWQAVTAKLKVMLSKERDGLWGNGCFMSHCEGRRGPSRDHKIKEIITHMKKEHLSSI